jgi:hypothetical protein
VAGSGTVSLVVAYFDITGVETSGSSIGEFTTQNSYL